MGYNLSIKIREINMKNLSVFDKHQLKIAKQTLKMSDVGAKIMGGMTKEEAKNIIKKFSSKNFSKK
jgi:hypothetical protein